MSRIDRVLRTLFFGWLLGAAFVVAAAEITFYEYPGFGGQSLTLRGYTPNFGDIGFNDRAASIVVRSGSWQVCTDGEFKGNCVTLARGDYRVLDERFDGRISSAREVGSYGGDTGVYSRYGRGSVELFEEANFGGRSVVLDRDAVNFESIGFNDQAGSAIVRDGTWELCIGSEYRGTCRSYAVGRYADLGPGMAKLVSSARMTGVFAEAPYVIGGGTFPRTGDRRHVDRPTANGRLILYENDRFGGRSIALTENMVDLANTGFNDAAASAVVESGYWEVCADAFFRGQCRILSPGRQIRLEGTLYKAISSVRAVRNPETIRPVPNQADLVLFEHDNFTGRRFDVRSDVVDLSTADFNDITSSLIVNSGQWQVCVDAYYAGRCVVYGPGQYANLLGLNDRLSSVRRLSR